MSRRLYLCLLYLAALAALWVAPTAAQAGFGVDTFTTTFTNKGELPDVLAASHPYEFTTHIVMNQDAEGHREGTLQKLLIELPPGMVGDPMSLPRCTRAEFDLGVVPLCPGNSQVGVAEFELNQGGLKGRVGVYNLTPTPGSAATIGFSVDNNNALLNASVRTGSDYGATITDAALPVAHELQQVTTHIWGVPQAKVHDPERNCVPEDPEAALIEGCAAGVNEAAFFSLPTRCGEELETTLIVYSTEGEEEEAVAKAPALEGCEAIPFEPQITARPETAAAESPSGLAVSITIPQSRDPKQRATAHLKDTAVTLPAGLTVNPSAASGRSACSEDQIALGKSAPANCPDSSQVGTVTVESPLVDHPLQGAVYLARQGENPFGSLIALYVALNDPLTGVVVKQAIEVVPDESGRLTAFTKEMPQLPFEHLAFNFFGGPRAALTTPSTCGTYTTETTFTPWSAPEGKPVKESNSFGVTEAAHGGPCPTSEAQMPNDPSFQAGTSSPLAGAYSPFVLKLTRENGSQRLSALNVTMPPGITAKLAGVSECSDPQIAASGARNKLGDGALELASPSCPKSSEVGTVTVGAGSGTPIYVQGHAYLAGPYKGAPLSIVIITPAVAGPFDLGVVVVRTALFIDETTAQVTAKSDPIPQILQGIPLAVRSIAVRLDRSQFTLNPTSCAVKQISGQAISPLGTAAPLQQSFAAAGCNGLGFKPNLTLSLKGGTHRGAHPALTATLTPRPGDANIASAQVSLPHSEFLDQAHIKTICTRVQFAANACPAGSIYGKARAFSPLLDKPLEGPVYLRSSSHNLPDLVADLNGQVHFVLAGRVDSVGGGIRNTFESTPDAPVSKFVLEMQGAKKGLLVNSTNLCKGSHKAKAAFTGQNGKRFESEPPLAASCSKAKKQGKGKKHRTSRLAIGAW
jgi:hypothetical protein